jgi:prolyl-tRNA editing enzyme YbaK/EbsC (Cys-tRNA(Pro) deacylase)
MPVYVEDSILALETIYINGGRRGYLVGIAAGAGRAAQCQPVHCALAE